MSSGARQPGNKSSSTMNHLWGKLLSFLRLCVICHIEVRYFLKLWILNENHNHAGFNYYCYNTNNLCVLSSGGNFIYIKLYSILKTYVNLDSLNHLPIKEKRFFSSLRDLSNSPRGVYLGSQVLTSGRAHSSHHIMLPLGWSLRKEHVMNQDEPDLAHL